MTEQEFTAAAERLETIHKQFANMVMMLIEGFKKMETYLESYATSFEANLNSYHQTTELLHSYADSMRKFLAGMEAVVKIAGESNVAIAETNEQLKELRSKFDTYFGDSAGLEHNN
jgi:molybdopterin-guanine dinucleotide biosynthesis protein